MCSYKILPYYPHIISPLITRHRAYTPFTHHGLEYNTLTRARVLELRGRVFAAKIKEITSVPPRIQTDINKSGSARRPRKESKQLGRPHKIDDDIIKKMMRSLKKYYAQKKKRWEE